jgi:hypothetical protein
VDYLLVTCQLAHHLQTARPLVCSIKDILPEEKLPELVAWLLRTANQVIVDHDAEQCAIAAWKVLTEIAYRIPFLTAVGVLQAARSHHFFLHQHRFGRAAILRAIDALVGLGTASDLRELAQELLPAATTNKWDYDYAEALHVLATIVRRSPETKESIHAALFNQKTASTDVKLASYAEVFGHQIKPETLKVSVSKIAEHLARQVQIAPPEPSTFLLHSFGTRDITATTGSIRIAMRGGAAELDYVVSNKSLVPTQSLEELVNTVIDLIQNRFNDRANRTMLMEFLVRVRDRLSSEQCARASACLAKFAVDEDKEAVSDLPVPSTTDRMKWHGTSPAEQRATALRAMALLTQDHPECFNSEMYALLLDGVLHQESLIRRVACASIGDLAAPPSTLLIPLLLASLDCDFEVAGTALHAATRVLHSVDVQANASLLIAIASKTSTAPKALVRGLSAKFSAVLRRQPLAPEHQMAIAVLRAALQTDISFEVRRAATD